MFAFIETSNTLESNIYGGQKGAKHKVVFSFNKNDDKAVQQRIASLQVFFL